jgi:hypothetical protein
VPFAGDHPSERPVLAQTGRMVGREAGQAYSIVSRRITRQRQIIQAVAREASGDLVGRAVSLPGREGHGIKDRDPDARALGKALENPGLRMAPPSVVAGQFRAVIKQKPRR